MKSICVVRAVRMPLTRDVQGLVWLGSSPEGVTTRSAPLLRRQHQPIYPNLNLFYHPFTVFPFLFLNSITILFSYTLNTLLKSLQKLKELPVIFHFIQSYNFNHFLMLYMDDYCSFSYPIGLVYELNGFLITGRTSYFYKRHNVNN